MSQAMTARVPAQVTLATTVTRLTRTAFEQWRSITFTDKVSGSISVIYLDLAGTADGGAVPTSRIAIPVTVLPASYDVTGYGAVGVAGDAAGVVEMVLS